MNNNMRTVKGEDNDAKDFILLFKTLLLPYECRFYY